MTSQSLHDFEPFDGQVPRLPPVQSFPQVAIDEESERQREFKREYEQQEFVRTVLTRLLSVSYYDSIYICPSFPNSLF